MATMKIPEKRTNAVSRLRQRRQKAHYDVNTWRGYMLELRRDNTDLIYTYQVKCVWVKRVQRQYAH